MLSRVRVEPKPLPPQLDEAHLRIGSAVDLGHVIGDRKQAAEAGLAKVADRQERATHQEPPPEITTPSAVTLTLSSELVGRFLPT